MAVADAPEKSWVREDWRSAWAPAAWHRPSGEQKEPSAGPAGSPWPANNSWPAAADVWGGPAAWPGSWWSSSWHGAQEVAEAVVTPAAPATAPHAPPAGLTEQQREARPWQSKYIGPKVSRQQPGSVRSWAQVAAVGGRGSNCITQSTQRTQRRSRSAGAALVAASCRKASGGWNAGCASKVGGDDRPRVFGDCTSGGGRRIWRSAAKQPEAPASASPPVEETSVALCSRFAAAGASCSGWRWGEALETEAKKSAAAATKAPEGTSTSLAEAIAKVGLPAPPLPPRGSSGASWDWPLSRPESVARVLSVDEVALVDAVAASQRPAGSSVMALPDAMASKRPW